jgi:hypothetical protein
LTSWCCDACGQQIEKADQGHVIWQWTGSLRYSGFKIIHKQRCNIEMYSSSAELSDFLGPRGVVYLTTFLSVGPIKLSLGQRSDCFVDPMGMDAFVDLFRRVQVPYYEEARGRFARPALTGERDDQDESGRYLPETLRRMVERC